MGGTEGATPHLATFEKGKENKEGTGNRGRGCKQTFAGEQGREKGSYAMAGNRVCVVVMDKDHRLSRKGIK